MIKQRPQSSPADILRNSKPMRPSYTKNGFFSFRIQKKYETFRPKKIKVETVHAKKDAEYMPNSESFYSLKSAKKSSIQLSLRSSKSSDSSSLKHSLLRRHSSSSVRTIHNSQMLQLKPITARFNLLNTFSDIFMQLDDLIVENEKPQHSMLVISDDIKSVDLSSNEFDVIQVFAETQQNSKPSLSLMQVKLSSEKFFKAKDTVNANISEANYDSALDSTFDELLRIYRSDESMSWQTSFTEFLTDKPNLPNEYKEPHNSIVTRSVSIFSLSAHRASEILDCGTEVGIIEEYLLPEVIVEELDRTSIPKRKIFDLIYKWLAAKCVCHTSDP